MVNPLSFSILLKELDKEIVFRFLFFFVSDALAHFMRSYQNSNCIHGFLFNRHYPTHILFVDNTLLFGHASFREANYLK